jgi:hypothetical protein
MVRIARQVPAARDIEIAALAPSLLIAQLDRLLRSLPEQPDGDLFHRDQIAGRSSRRSRRD